MLAEGYSTRRGRHGALIHHDAVNQRIRGRRGARLTAITSGGTIPDTADYQVILEPQAQFVGTVNEDFAVESLQGDIFQLGNVSYRILRVEQGRIRVEDAHGEPPSIPFWLGEAPGRTDELSASVSRLRSGLEAHLDAGAEGACAWLVAEAGIDAPAAVQLVAYLAAARAALGALPTQQLIVLERFFDEAGGMQLVIHSPFGSRINRAWGLALRKRFCRSFNFELQAAATEDSIVLSLTTAHSFELEEVARYLHSNTVRPLLVQALCAAPMFPVRWRWSATIALALPRFRGGKKLPAPLARMAAEDLLDRDLPRPGGVRREPARRARDPRPSAGTPGDPRLPRGRHGRRGLRAAAARARGRQHPLRGTRSHRALAARTRGALGAPVRLPRRRAARGAPHPGGGEPPLARPAERCRPRQARRRGHRAGPRRGLAGRHRPPTSCTMRCCGSASSPRPRRRRGPAGRRCWRRSPRRAASTLLRYRRRSACGSPPSGCRCSCALYPQARLEPAVTAPAAYQQELAADGCAARGGARTPDRARADHAPRRSPPHSACRPGRSMPRSPPCRPKASSCAARSRPSPPAADEWCERRLLARIHRYTVKRLRAEIEPIEARDFLRFLFEWQRVTRECAHGGAGCGRGGAGAARGLRGAGERLGDRDAARAHQRVRAGLAR